MKVRITGNKIRYRLKQAEVRQFDEAGLVTETLSFGFAEMDQLKFSLQKADTEEIAVSFQDCHVVVLVPVTTSNEWTTTGQIGFEAEVLTEKGSKVFVLVEKDFACIDGREEDNEGTYPNPLMQKTSLQ